MQNGDSEMERKTIQIEVVALNGKCADCPFLTLERIYDYKSPNHIKQECKHLDMCAWATKNKPCKL